MLRFLELVFFLRRGRNCIVVALHLYSCLIIQYKVVSAVSTSYFVRPFSVMSAISAVFDS
jgi:hypothetical protein